MLIFGQFDRGRCGQLCERCDSSTPALFLEIFYTSSQSRAIAISHRKDANPGMTVVKCSTATFPPGQVEREGFIIVSFASCAPLR